MKFLLLLSILFFPLSAQQTPSKLYQSSLKKLDENRYRLGNITIDKTKKQISFPATINQNEGLIEYALISPIGPTHETPFISKISSLHLHLGLLLLNYQPEPPEFFNQLSQKPQDQANLKILVQWQNKQGKTKQYPLEKLFLREPPSKKKYPFYWVFSGISSEKTAQKIENISIFISIFFASEALIHYHTKGIQNDEIWYANEKLLPPLGTQVQILILPHSSQ